MKSSKIFAIIMAPLFIFSCSAKKTVKDSETQNSNQIEKDSRIEKLNLVFSKMSERFQKEIQISDPYKFIDDLQKILEVEKSFPQDDLSLYYLIDKKHSVSKDYEPKNLQKLVKNDDYAINRNDLSLRPDVEKSLRQMARAAKEDGITLLVSSTYRSYDYQAKLFQRWVDIDGLEEAERESARPGTSQHQLGAAVDFGSITDDYAETKQGKWVYENAGRFGWSLSFPQDYEDITGYRWECWHFRYIGKEAVEFQEKYFKGVQQYMLEFINEWKSF